MSSTDDQSNLFDDVLNDAQGVQDRLLGPTYPYYMNIKTPSQIGMSDKGSLAALGKDIDGLVQYTELLVTGKSKASATGGPLGNKFFLKTGGKCTDPSGADQDRYIYVNNVPSGNIPFLSSGMGVNFSEFKGLVPGSLGNLNALNPYAIMGAFLSGSEPACRELTMETIDVNNNRGTETHYITTVDIKNMDPCWFSNGRNPINEKQCRETFTSGINSSPAAVLPQNTMTQLYFAGLAGVGIYALYCLSRKR